MVYLRLFVTVFLLAQTIILSATGQPAAKQAPKKNTSAQRLPFLPEGLNRWKMHTMKSLRII